MKIDPGRGRQVTLTEPLGIVRTLGSLLLLCSFVSISHGLLMVRDHDHGVGISSPPFWIATAFFMLVAGVAFSSPPRSRWVFDLDHGVARSLRVRFNIPEGEGSSFPMAGLEKAEVVKASDGAYYVEMVDLDAKRFRLEGVKSRLAGWPRRAAYSINNAITEYHERNRSTAMLNDPSVALREVGIVLPVDPVLVGPALEELWQTLSPRAQGLTRQLDTAYDIALAVANHFAFESQRGLDFPGIQNLSALQQVLYFDLCVPILSKMTRAQYAALEAALGRKDDRRLQDAIYYHALGSRFERYVSKHFRLQSVEPPTAVDLQSVLPECRMAIATIAATAHGNDRHLNPPRNVEGREVVYAEATGSDRPSTLSLKSYRAGIEELSSGMVAAWVQPAPTTAPLHTALLKILETAPVPMRIVLMRACSKAASIDDILDPRVWLLLRAYADTLQVNVPTSVIEPVAESRATGGRPSTASKYRAAGKQPDRR